jgi:hypothetical protein
MSNQIKMVPSLVLATLLTSVVSTVAACVAARAADNCLNEPRHYAPGSHWYYRFDSPNHRKCWFLGDEGRHVSQAGSPRPSASSPPPLPQQTAASIQPSLADAHAEMPMVTTPTEQPQWSSSTRISNPDKITGVVPDASPSETLSPPSAHDLKGESRVMRNGVIDGQSRTESVADREPAAELSAEETSADPLRVRFALLLIVLGLSTIAGCLILRPSAAVQAGRRDVFSSR